MSKEFLDMAELKVMYKEALSQGCSTEFASNAVAEAARAMYLAEGSLDQPLALAARGRGPAEAPFKAPDFSAMESVVADAMKEVSGG